MGATDEPQWGELSELPTVRAIERVLGRRWNLGLGFVAAGDAGPGAAHPPRARACAEVQARPGGSEACARHARAMARAGVRGDAELKAPCHAGMAELAVPIRARGELVGTLLCGGLADADAPSRPLGAQLMGEGELETLRLLLNEAADAIASHAPAGRRRPATDIEKPFATRYSYDSIVGRSEAMQELYGILDHVVDSEATVLIQGENGTGKELVARAIHYNSPRKTRRFVAQNCSAFNDNLLDSELFGHRRGAFTGAVADKRGLFEIADQGTFFLDEVGEMSPALQVKVLRAVQEGTFTPVGDTEPRQVDVRLIAATNRDLHAMVTEGQFREDLYYRLNVINLAIPPLRKRRDDIELLIDHFLARHARTRRTHKSLSSACKQRLLDYSWPGNVRELENELERLVVLSGAARVVGEEHLSPRIRQPENQIDVGGGAPADEPARSLPEATTALERRMIGDALARYSGNKSQAARELGISRRNLIRLAQKYELG